MQRSKLIQMSPVADNEELSDSDSGSDSEMDLDLTVDFMSLSTEAQAAINTVGKSYNLGKADFVKFLARDIEEAQELRNAKLQEEEKAMFSVSFPTRPQSYEPFTSLYLQICEY